MSWSVDSLLFISKSLLLPVVAALFLLALVRLLDSGGFVGEWWDRRCHRGKWKATCQTLIDETKHSYFDDSIRDLEKYRTMVGVFATRCLSNQFHELAVDKHATDLEIESYGRLARLSFSIRVAPMLGLMGTLIPLGPALMNLSAGDIGGMAEQLAIAFGTTVLGLFIGGVAYGQWLVRRQWYARDLADIEFLQNCIASHRERDR